jgi:hypothetical protein
MPFYAPGFDPVLISSQIVAMQARRAPPRVRACARAASQRVGATRAQSLMYLDLGLWLLVLNGLAGRPLASVGLQHFFSYTALELSFTGGWVTSVAFFLNSLAGACFLCIVVERAKKCLDFAATAHILHLLNCTVYGGLPTRRGEDELHTEDRQIASLTDSLPVRRSQLGVVGGQRDELGADGPPRRVPVHAKRAAGAPPPEPARRRVLAAPPDARDRACRTSRGAKGCFSE